MIAGYHDRNWFNETLHYNQLVIAYFDCSLAVSCRALDRTHFTRNCLKRFPNWESINLLQSKSASTNNNSIIPFPLATIKHRLPNRKTQNSREHDQTRSRSSRMPRMPHDKNLDLIESTTRWSAVYHHRQSLPPFTDTYDKLNRNRFTMPVRYHQQRHRHHHHHTDGGQLAHTDHCQCNFAVLLVRKMVATHLNASCFMRQQR